VQLLELSEVGSANLHFGGKDIGQRETLELCRKFHPKSGFYQNLSGANPTIVSYNARVVKIYSATSSLVRFENQIKFFYFEKRSGLLQRWHCSCKFTSRRIGS
jgi:hypothetical protein